MKIAIVFFMLQTAILLFAGDKPLWIIDINPKGTLRAQFHYLQELNNPNSNIIAGFTSENDVLITFFRHGMLDNRKTKNINNSKPTAFVALLVHGETGELIKRVEWPVDESIASGEIHFRALPEVGYLLRVGDNLQALDSSLNVIRSKILEPLPKNQGYSVITQRAGYYFVVEQWVLGKERSYEIYDWRTFEIVEKI